MLSVLVAQLVDRLGGDGFWDRDYGWGVRVRRPFGARGMSSVRYGTRLGDLKNKQSTHTSNFWTLEWEVRGYVSIHRAQKAIQVDDCRPRRMFCNMFCIL